MDNVYKLPQQKQRYEEASQWIAKLDRQLTEDETIALQDWLTKDPKNKSMLLEMSVLWDKMDSMRRLSSLFPEPLPQPRAMRAASYSLAAFASLVLAVSLWLFSAAATDSTLPSTASPELAYQTDIGEQSTVTLQDGTQLVLNTNSKVTVNYTDDARLLTLARGEISVKVAKDKTRPLSVFAEGQRFQAIGTAFNIEIQEHQQIELVVLEGIVRVGDQEPANVSINSATPPPLPPSSKTLVAGESLLLGSTDNPINQVSPEDIAVKLSWQQGSLIFRGESLEQAVEEVARYTAVEFVFMDEDLKKIRVAGLFRAGDVDGLLATLKENFNIVHQFRNKQQVELSLK